MVDRDHHAALLHVRVVSSSTLSSTRRRVRPPRKVFITHAWCACRSFLDDVREIFNIICALLAILKRGPQHVRRPITVHIACHISGEVHSMYT